MDDKSAPLGGSLCLKYMERTSSLFQDYNDECKENDLQLWQMIGPKHFKICQSISLLSRFAHKPL